MPSSLIMSDMRAPGRHLTCTEKDYPPVPPMGTNKAVYKLFIETCVPKRDARAGASEALRLCKFRASVPSGSPLFLSRESLRSYHGCCHHSPRRPWRADGRHNRTHSARKQSPQPRRRSICDQQPQSAVRLSGSWPARGSATASLVMGLAIRAWARRFTINVPATTYSVATHCRPDWSQ